MSDQSQIEVLDVRDFLETFVEGLGSIFSDSLFLVGVSGLIPIFLDCRIKAFRYKTAKVSENSV